jgi:hypothetical protein
MLSRLGPVPIHSIRTPRYSSMKRMYFLQFSGSAWNEVVVPIDVFHPGSVSYTTSTLSSKSRSAIVRRTVQRADFQWCCRTYAPGKPGSSFPSTRYFTPTLTSGRSSSISSLVILRVSYPLIKHECFITTKSNHPHRRLLPVVVPNSRPTSWKWVPISYPHLISAKNPRGDNTDTR